MYSLWEGWQTERRSARKVPVGSGNITGLDEIEFEKVQENEWFKPSGQIKDGLQKKDSLDEGTLRGFKKLFKIFSKLHCRFLEDT